MCTISCFGWQALGHGCAGALWQGLMSTAALSAAILVLEVSLCCRWLFNLKPGTPGKASYFQSRLLQNNLIVERVWLFVWCRRHLDRG